MYGKIHSVNEYLKLPENVRDNKAGWRDVDEFV